MGQTTSTIEHRFFNPSTNITQNSRLASDFLFAFTIKLIAYLATIKDIIILYQYTPSDNLSSVTGRCKCVYANPNRNLQQLRWRANNNDVENYSIMYY